MPARRRMVLLQDSSSRAVEAEARHAGIDVQDRRQPAPGFTRAAVQASSSAREPSAGTMSCARYSVSLPGTSPLSTASIASGTSCADCQCLIEQGDEEVAATGCVQRRRDRTRAESVGVGLHHAGDGTGWMARAGRCQLATIAARSISRTAAAGDACCVIMDRHASPSGRWLSAAQSSLAAEPRRMAGTSFTGKPLAASRGWPCTIVSPTLRHSCKLCATLCPPALRADAWFNLHGRCARRPGRQNA